MSRSRDDKAVSAGIGRSGRHRATGARGRPGPLRPAFVVRFPSSGARDGSGPARRECGGRGQEADRRGSGGSGRRDYSACTCGPTAFDQALPAEASQFVDQVIAPRRAG